MFSEIYGILDQSLNVLSDKQNLIASNIANANTPGYKAKTMNFEEVMDALVPQDGSLKLKEDSPEDISPGSPSSSSSNPGIVKTFVKNEVDDSVPPLDGNTVDLNKEMSSMADNSIRFQAVAGLLTKKFTILNYAITESNP